MAKLSGEQSHIVGCRCRKGFRVCEPAKPKYTEINYRKKGCPRVGYDDFDELNHICMPMDGNTIGHVCVY